MWSINRRKRNKRNIKKGKYRVSKDIKSLNKENQIDFVVQIKFQSENYRSLNLQKHDSLIEQEKQLQLEHHKQINLKNERNCSV